MTWRRIAGACAAAAVAFTTTPANADFRVEGGRLVDRCGQPFVMRGVNLTHAWAPEHTRQSIRDVARAGANTVRITVGTGNWFRRSPKAEVRGLLRLARSQRLITVLSVHDTTGWGAADEAVHLGAVLPYWFDLRNVLHGREDYVLINIANEPMAGSATPAMWLEANRTAIAALRAAGLRHTIVIDADGYGQDAAGTMRETARELFESDPLRNVVFSVHMYQTYGTDDAVVAYLEAFRTASLPLIVGEFGPDHHGEPVAEQAILESAERLGFGWLAWSWSGNGPPARNLDMVEGFDADRVTDWGRLVIDGPLGLRATSRTAGVFGGARGRRECPGGMAR